MTPLLVAQIGLTLFVFVALLSSAAGMVLVERKVAAFLQQRLGPYLVGPWGILQPLADVIKLMFKEELRPAAADKWRKYQAEIEALLPGLQRTIDRLGAV